MISFMEKNQTYLQTTYLTFLFLKKKLKRKDQIVQMKSTQNKEYLQDLKHMHHHLVV